MGTDVRRLTYIDAMRGYAILGVIVVHVGQYVPGLEWPLSALATEGARGVQLFFVTSALTLMLSSNARSDGVAAFYVRRIFRIAPMFWLAIPLFVALVGFAPRYWAPHGIGWSHILATVLFLHGFHPDTLGSVVPGGWTIAVEMTFYALFPTLAYALRSWRSTALALIGTIFFAYLLYPVTIAVFERLTPNEGHDLLKAFSFSWFPTQLPAFLTGILVFHLLREFSGSLPRRVLEVGVAVSVGTAALLPLLIGSTKILLFAAYVLDFGLLAFCLGQGAGRSLIRAPIRYLGTISYSAYFWHFVALWAVGWLDIAPPQYASALPGWLQFLILLAVVIITTTIASTITHRLIEQPMIRIGRQLAEKVEITPGPVGMPATPGATSNPGFQAIRRIAQPVLRPSTTVGATSRGGAPEQTSARLCLPLAGFLGRCYAKQKMLKQLRRNAMIFTKPIC
jgi:peptidoglycan/LPS O-acetylase OafA/YrhL